MKTVNILGTEYTIKNVKISECSFLKDNNFSGSCNSQTKEILIGDPTEEEYFGKLTEQEQTSTIKEVLRHEIVHAFFNESGLQQSSNQCEAWAINEEMVDWIAIQSPKMFKAFQEADCL